MKYLKIISLTIVLFMFGCSAKKSDLDLLTIPKKDYEATQIQENDVVEVVSFVGGG